MSHSLMVGAALACFIVLCWPYRRIRRLTIQRVVRAPQDLIWRILTYDPDDAICRKARPHLKSAEKINDSPEIWDLYFDTSRRDIGPPVRVTTEVLAEDRPVFHAQRINRIAERCFPYGVDQRSELRLEAQGDETLVKFLWQGQTACLGHAGCLWLCIGCELKNMARIAETRLPKLANGLRNGLRVSIGTSLLTVLCLFVFLDWFGALTMVGVFLVHQFGHWLAMRLTGQPAPRIVPIPVVGGMPVPNLPHRTLFADAFCSLMGAGFSAPLAALFLCLALFFDPAFDFRPLTVAFTAGPEANTVACQFYRLALVTGVLNLAQLLPVWPLDGGQVLRTVAQSFAGQRLAMLFLVLTAGGIAGTLYLGNVIIAAVLVLVLVQAWHLKDMDTAARPMEAAGIAAILAGYLASVLVHGLAAYRGWQVLVAHAW